MCYIDGGMRPSLDRNRMRTRGRTGSRAGRCDVLKAVSKTKKGKKVVSVVRYSKSDAQMLIRLISKPFEPNAAAREAKRLNAAIPRLTASQNA